MWIVLTLFTKRYALLVARDFAAGLMFAMRYALLVAGAEAPACLI